MCAAGLKSFRRIVVGKETAHAPNTTGTARLIGTLGMKQDQKYWRPEDYETGKLSSFEYSAIIHEQAALPFNSDATYEQLGYLLAMAIKGGVTPGAPTDSLYTWTFLPNLTAVNNPDSYTIQYGDDVQAFISSFCFAQDLEISGSIEDALKVKAGLVGQNVRAGTFTAVTNPTALTPIPTSTGKLYIDTSWANLGNTNVAGTLVDFAYKVTAGIAPVKYGDGEIHYTDISEKKRHIEMDVTFAFTSGVAGYFANYIASPQTKQFIRLKFLGPLVGATAKDELDLDGCFIIDNYDTLGEREGQDIVKIRMVSLYDSVATKEWQIILKNSLASLP